MSPPIGAVAGPPPRSTVVGIPPGAMLCLYTDGLVERRDEPLDVGIRRLSAALGGLAEMACATVMRALVGNAPAMDDVAVLVLHRRPGPRGGQAHAASALT